jgi:hypothetical protein
MTWHEVVRTFANESEIGRGNKLLDPEVRPSNPLLGDSAIQAYVEDHLRHWRDLTCLRQRAGEGDLGFVGARRDAFLASSEEEARARCCAQ